MQEYEMANAYIGDPRTPGDDVIAYLRLNQNTQTTSEAGTLTWSGTNITYDSIWAYFNWTSSSKITANTNLSDMTNATIAFWIKFNPSDLSGQSNQQWWLFFDWTSQSWYDFWLIVNSSLNIYWCSKGWNLAGNMSLWTWDTTKYHCIVATRSWNTVTIYKDWAILWTASISWNCNVGYHYTPTLWSLYDWRITDQNYKWRISNFVLSNKWRSLDESTAFYNATKWLYLN